MTLMKLDTMGLWECLKDTENMTRSMETSTGITEKRRKAMSEDKSCGDVVPPKQICLTPECQSEARWKGLCSSCYGQAKQLIDENKTTWEELQEMGLAQLKNKPFKEAFLKAKQKKEESKLVSNSPVTDDIYRR